MPDPAIPRMRANAIRIVLVDDHAIVREGFRTLIEREPDMTIVTECASLLAVDGVLAATHADVLVLDITMRDGSGLAALPDLHARHPRVRMLVLSMHEGKAYVGEALARGADGYVTKAAGPEELIAGIRAVVVGQRYVSKDVAERTHESARASLGNLSAREHEVFLGLARGDSPKQVAFALGISVKTAYVHRANVLAKLDARSDRDLYRIALEAGLLDG